MQEEGQMGEQMKHTILSRCHIPVVYINIKLKGQGEREQGEIIPCKRSGGRIELLLDQARFSDELRSALSEWRRYSP